MDRCTIRAGYDPSGKPPGTTVRYEPRMWCVKRNVLEWFPALISQFHCLSSDMLTLYIDEYQTPNAKSLPYDALGYILY